MEPIGCLQVWNLSHFPPESRFQREHLKPVNGHFLGDPELTRLNAEISRRDTVEDLLSIGQSGLAAVHPERLVRNTLSAGANHVVQVKIPSSGATMEFSFRKAMILAIGKAAPGMAAAANDVFETHIPGVGICPRGIAPAPPGWLWLQGDHPFSSDRSLHAGQALACAASSMGRGDVVLVLLSGGASALASIPRPPLTSKTSAEVCRLLMESGASIDELNAVRRRMDLLKAVGLARLAAPAATIALIISDVPGNRLSDIGSGPTTGTDQGEPDPISVLRKYGLFDSFSPHVLSLLHPRPPRCPFPRPVNIIIGANETALDAVSIRAKSLNYETIVYPRTLRGEAREMGVRVATLARGHLHNRRKICLLLGGETTVTVTGAGSGGRNQELALAFAKAIQDEPGIWLLSLGTDGKDGSSPAAGAIVHSRTISEGKSMGLDVDIALSTNNSYNYLKKIGAAVTTGPTGTNVSDIVIVLINPRSID